MSSLGGRQFLQGSSRPSDLFRILCVGDSMVFGQGVDYSATLPFQLETSLNRAVWGVPFEVVNAGVCGHSFYHGWQRVLRLYEHYHPDLAVLVLCDNDAEIFGSAELGISYEEHVKSLWEPSNPSFACFSDALDAFEHDLESREIPCVVVFYSIPQFHGFVDAARRLAELCDGRYFDYVDISGDFKGPEVASVNTSMVVSAWDDHPSAYAHGIAARSLARQLIKRGIVPRSDEAQPEALLAERTISAAISMLEGRSTEFPLQWARRVLEARHDSPRRDRLADALCDDDTVHAARMRELDAVIRAWRTMLHWEGFSEYIKNNRGRSWSHGQHLHQMSLDLHKLSFLALGGSRNGTPYRIVPPSIHPASPITDHPEEPVEELARAINAAETVLREWDDLGKSVPLISDHLARSAANMRSSVLPRLDEARSLYRIVREGISGCQEVRSRVSVESIQRQAVENLLSGMLHGLHRYSRTTGFDMAKVAIRDELFTALHLEIASQTQGAVIQITLYASLPEIFVSEPWPLPVREGIQTLSLRLPRIARGSLALTLYGSPLPAVRSLRLVNSPEWPVVWAPQPADRIAENVLRTPQLWLPG